MDSYTPSHILCHCSRTAILLHGPRAVLLKGGHITTTISDVDRLARAHPEVRVVRDGLYGENIEVLAINGPQLEGLVVDVRHEADGTTTVLMRPRIRSSSTHGTGCTLSATPASAFASGDVFVLLLVVPCRRCIALCSVRGDNQRDGDL
ncbi:hypothetical protein B0H10DRAFT_1983840 [Mycena sp. CBHHK59/15]|nr:hypothetical protein B0H10DRAFT_1983840 [Mycena sp. CBHHK59/15]